MVALTKMKTKLLLLMDNMISNGVSTWSSISCRSRMACGGDGHSPAVPWRALCRFRCLEALGDRDGAEKEYLTAHYMVPYRLYPLTLLMDMYISSGRPGDAVRTGETILAMPVNERHPAMSKMNRETEEKLVSLKNYGADN